jgi:transketolase
VILAKTRKGEGFSEIADHPGWHGKPLPEDMAERAIAELGGVRHLRVEGLLPDPEAFRPSHPLPVPVTLPTYEVGDKVATRKAYGQALAAVGVRTSVVALDAEVGNSTYSEDFQKAFPDRFFEIFIAEQQLIAAAVGLQVRGYIPFASTFAAFLSRAYDFIRMAAISTADIRLAGSHAGVEIGADGPSQMALEDLAMLRAVHGSTVLYPSDATSAAALVLTMAETSGISYMRTTRGAYPVLYPAGETFPIGGSKTPRSSDADTVTLIGAGVTLHQCLAAADALAADGISARVIDLYSVKPIDAETVSAAARATAGRVVVAEDHWAEGGLGSAVIEVLARVGVVPKVAHLAVRTLPGSGTPAELLDFAGISASHIADAARNLLRV